MMIPPMLWDRPRFREQNGETVILLHGLWRSWRAMEPMAKSLHEQGFCTLNLPYPSTRKSLDDLSDLIRDRISQVAGDKPVHLVTHSLGGILARKILSEKPSWNIGRLVMLAPPNRGSEIVDWASSHHRGLLALLGPSGKALSSQNLTSILPALPTGLEAAVIMGRRGTIPFFRKILTEENDGIVSVETGRIEGLCGFSVIDADHTFIQMHPEAIRQTIDFLKTGRWTA